MERVLTMLASLGWQRSNTDFHPPKGVVRPFLSKGNWRAIVGEKWTTIYRVTSPGHTAYYSTIETDVIAVRKVAVHTAGSDQVEVEA